jgi:N12 class adenine-specific DNA methylase
MIYNDPQGGWVTEDAYLSGNVKEKLVAAQNAAELDPAFQKNVDALMKVQPPDLQKEEIDVKLGSHWVDKDYIPQFAANLLRERPNSFEVGYNNLIAEWHFKPKDNAKYIRNGTAATIQFGTNDYDAIDLIEMTLNMKTATVRRTIKHPDGSSTSYVDQKATVAAREKQNAIKEEFQKWIWSDEKRANELVRLYNDRFNTDRLRQYNGEHLTFPGMNPGITLKPHQKDAVWRAMQSGNTLFAHAVGAGKTFEMIASMMELKRTGVINKPMWVVPNHLVEQMGSDFMKLYPAANILVAGNKDFEKEKRKKLFAKIATGNYDAVIVPHSSFGKISMSKDTVEKFYQDQLDQLELAMEQEVKEGSRKETGLAKKLRAARKRLQEKMQKQLSKIEKDDNVSFEELGVDSLVVDEAHEFKNLFYTTKLSRVAGLGNQEGSGKAFDLFMKTRYLQQLNGGKGVIFATGTPVSNSLAEMYTFQRYLQYNELEKRGIVNFDSWVSQFGEIKNVLELSPEGKGLRMRSRLTEVVNLPELLHLFRSFADVKTADELLAKKLITRPDMKDGKRNMVVSPPSEALLNLVEELAARAEAVRSGKVKPDEDNMLAIVGEGRKAALDMRLVDPSAPDSPDSKVNVAAAHIAEIYKKTKKFKTASGKTIDNGTQIVFLDLSTPKGEKMDKDGNTVVDDSVDAADISVYNDLRKKLIKNGVAAKDIAFIHDYPKDAQKEELFRKVNSGEIRILLGSTAKMGAGMNVQKRLTDLHHLDVPWRPSDVEQREGRILRQGNENEEVGIHAYITEKSFDAYMWQIIANKAKVVDQTMSGDLTSRRVVDPSGMEMSANEIKAAATGDERIITLANLDRDVAELELKYQSRVDTLRQLRWDAEQTPRQIKGYQNELAAAQSDLASRKDMKGENFTLELGKKSFKEREEAGQALIDLNKKTVMDHEEMKTIGSFGGFPVIVQGYKYLSDKVARNEYYLKGKQAYYPFSVTDTAAGTARSLEAALGRIDGRVKELGDKITHEQSELEKIQEQLVTQEQEAAGLREKYNEKLSAKLALEAELNLDGKADEIGAEGSDEGDDSGDDEGTPPRKSGKSYAMPSAAAAKKPRNTVKTRIQGLADSIQETDRVLTPRAAEKVADLIAEHLGTAIQKDYVQPRAEGTYTPSQGVGEVRGRSFSEWRTVGHELGHAFSDKLARIGDKEELRAMADALYPGGTKNMDVATQMEEGFAEFFRQWVADPDLAAQNAPKTTKLFENFIESDKKLKNVFSRVRTLVDNDFMNDELGRAVAGSIVHDVTDDGEAYGGQMYSVPAWRKLEFNVLDSTVPARALDAKVGKDLNDISLEKLMVIGAESSSMAEAYFNSIPRDKNGAFVGEKSLKDIFQSGVNLIGEKIQWKALKLDGVEEKQYKRMNAKDIFSAVAIAERINERYERGFRKLPMTPESAAKILEIADQRFPGLRDIINDYAETLSNAILDISVNEGIITPEVRAIVKAGSSHYIPLITDSKKANLLTGKSKSGRSYKSTVSRFKGEVAPVLDVYQATMMKLNELAKSVQYKRVLDQLSEYARVQDKSIGLFVKKIPQPVEASTFDAAAAAEKLGKMMGLDMAEIQDMADLVQGQDMTLFTPKGIGSINPNDPIIMNRYKGNIEYLRVAPDLYRMLTSLSSVQMNGVMQFLAKLSKLPRFTGLATARFMTNAVAVDITTALTQSKNPLSMMTTGTLESIKTMLGAYGHKLGIDTKWTQEAEAILDAFKASGGAAGSAESMIRTAAATSFKDDVVQMNAPGWGYATLRTGKRIVVRLINTPHDALRFIEEGPRLAEWITDVKKGMKEIRPDLSSRELFKTFINEGTDKLPVELQSEMERILVNAAYQSGEVTLPLGRRGASPVVRTWTASVPFMRGSLNGATKAAKMMFGKKTALRTWLTSTVFIGGLSALMYAMMGQNEDDKKVLEDLPSTTRDKYWVFPNGAAPGTYIYVKKPYEYAIAVNYAERFADQMYFNNKVSRKWNSDLRDPLPSTSWMSPWLQALREIEKNTNSLGGPIIPRSDENKFPAAQYGPTTSVTAREAANLYAQLVGDENGISPRVIDYYIKQTTGQWGGGALAGADMAFKLAQTGELKYGKDISGVEYSPILGSLVYGKAEGSSRVVDKFYSDLQTTQNLYATLQKYAKEKDISKLSEYATPENIQKLKMLPAMESLSKNMSDLRNAYGEIEGKDVDPIKAARLNAVQDYLEKYLAGLPYGFEPAYNEKAEISPAQLENMRQAFMADAQKKLDNELKHPGGVTDAAELLLKLYQRKQK